MSSSAGLDFSENVETVFHNVAYLVTISTINGDTLSLDVEQKSDCSRWRGDFTSRYIEDITSKTGNFKKFPVFVKMLLSALRQASDSVFVDLLTYQDLEVLKTRKAAAAGSGAPPARPATALAPNNKRYLILTYAAEFDRVHYPLPLLYEENPDPSHLKSVISQLRQEVDALHADVAGQGQANGRRGGGAAAAGGGEGGEVRRLKEENAALRGQVRQMEKAVALRGPDGQQDGGGGAAAAEAKEALRELKTVRKERDLLAARLEGAEAELERERGLHRRELRRKAKEMQEVMDELSGSKEQVRELRLRLRQLGDELDAARRRVSTNDRVRSAYAPRTSGDSFHSAGSGPSSRSNRAPSPSGYGYGAPAPAAGRSGSRGRDTSSRERGSYLPSSRPSSAPAKGRFDPTEYVRQKREREDAMARQRGRGATPTHSQPSSRGSSPAGSRPSSAERGRGHSPASSRPSSTDRGGRERGASGSGAPALGPQRSGSRERDRGSGGGGGGYGYGPSSSGRDYPPPPRISSPRGSTSSRASGGSTSVHAAAAAGARRPLNAWSDDPGPGGSGAWSKFPTGGAGGGGGPAGRSATGAGPGFAGGVAASAGPGGTRPASPGRALQEVKRKLSEFVGGKGEGPAAAGAADGAGGGTVLPAIPQAQPPQPGSTAGSLFDDASADIADIDSRLHALQNFLRMAKQAPGAAGQQPAVGRVS